MIKETVIENEDVRYTWEMNIFRHGAIATSVIGTRTPLNNKKIIIKK